MVGKSLKKWWPVFVLPTLAAFIIGFLWPFIWGIYLSFCKFSTVKDVVWVGLSNYQKIFIGGDFSHAFWLTVVFAFVSSILINVLAFSIALALTKGFKGTNVFRTVFFMPNLIGGIVLGYIWQTLLNGLLSMWGQPLLKLSATNGFIGMIILLLWQQIGYMMIIYVAGLNNVSPDLIEAAQIDGCTPFQTFWKVTFPLLGPCTGSMVILNGLGIWNDYLMPYLALPSGKAKTITVEIASFVGQYTARWDIVFAGTVISIVPALIIFCMFQKYFVKGITAGAAKG